VVKRRSHYARVEASPCLDSRAARVIVPRHRDALDIAAESLCLEACDARSFGLESRPACDQGRQRTARSALRTKCRTRREHVRTDSTDAPLGGAFARPTGGTHAFGPRAASELCDPLHARR
jgi:hypothetical protein